MLDKFIFDEDIKRVFNCLTNTQIITQCLLKDFISDIKIINEPKKRDKILLELDEKYPEYEFKKHKGYPTKKHIELMNKYGIIDEYRISYKPVKELYEKKIFNIKK